MTGPAPLLERPDGGALFLRPGGAVSSGAFLRDAAVVAAALPEGRYLINLCRDRYGFAVAFAAGLMRGRTALLNGDVGALAAGYPGCTVVVDELPAAHATGGLPWTMVQASGVGAGAVGVPEFPAEFLAAIVFTSGSTGAPTPHLKTWGGLVERSRAAGVQFGAEGRVMGGTVIGTVPPQHMYGFELTVLLPLHVPVTSWCGPAFFPGDVDAALLACPGRAVLVTTPLQLRALVQAELRRPPACVISATAPLDEALARQAEAIWGAPVMEIFGATECGSIASRRTTAGAEWRGYPGVTFEAGEEGTAVLAPGMAAVPLADVVELTEDGFRLLGRRTDLVKLGGRRASLLGLNQVLTGLEGVDDGAFVVPEDLDQRSTARLVAVVVAPGRSVSAILAELRLLVDPVFLPRRVIQVERLPRNALGKLPRQALLQLVAAAGPG